MFLPENINRGFFRVTPCFHQVNPGGVQTVQARGLQVLPVFLLCHSIVSDTLIIPVPLSGGDTFMVVQAVELLESVHGLVGLPQVRDDVGEELP